jgi:hypothetical protein
MKQATIAAAVVVGLLRPLFMFVDFNHHIDMIYQAVAHCLVGGLAGAWLMLDHLGWTKDQDYITDYDWMAVTFWALAAVEVACAIVIPALTKLIAMVIGWL